MVIFNSYVKLPEGRESTVFVVFAKKKTKELKMKPIESGRSRKFWSRRFLMELDTGCGRYFGSLSKKQRVLPSFDPAFTEEDPWYLWVLP